MSGPERRLAAIAVADVVGYSRMVAEDEVGTLAALRAHLRALDPIVANHGGRVVKTTGDGMIVEYPSAAAAVTASIEVQTLMRRRNAELPSTRHMELRIGVHVADVFVEESGDLLGDGVNVAARVESSSEPGGVAVTNTVYEAVRDRLDVTFIDAGELEFKNLPRPLRIWRTTGDHAARSVPATTSPPQRVLATVAVLPFDNLSGDDEQEYFADGIAEDLLTSLARDPNLAVIARNSTFAYKGRATDVRVIARELDATHVVEGSVRRAGGRVRVTAQLVDAENGHHVWAERYDRDLEDIFALQDELVAEITSRLAPTLWDAEGRRREHADPRSLDAWDLTIRARHVADRYTVEGLLEAIELLDRARELDPTSVDTVAMRGGVWLILAFFGWRAEGVNAWELGAADAREAHRLDPRHPEAIGAAAAIAAFSGRAEEAEAHARRLIDLDPNKLWGHHWLGVSLQVRGEWEAAIGAASQAWRLARHHPWRFDIASDLTYSHYMLERYEAALEWGERSVRLNPDYHQAHVVLAAVTARLGGPEAARPHVEAILEVRPDFSCARYREHIIFRRDGDRDHLVEGLVAAGLPA